MLEGLVDFIVGLVGSMGYVGIFIMMVLESSFFPFPSEVAMLPAGYLVSTGEMNFGIALLMGTAGALLGSCINYILGYYLGDKVIKSLINNYGKYIFVSLDHYEKAEIFFKKHGVITTFIGRFITVIRQYISLPAGVFKMNFLKFVIFTTIGAGMWNIILMTIGYIAGENKELIAIYSKEASIGIIIFIILVISIYVYKNKKKK